MKKYFQYLAFLGTLPFVFCAACLVFDVQTIPILGDTRNVLGIYALVITAFMAGSHWGQHLDFDSKWGDYLPITSNVIAVLVWIGFLTLPFKGSLIVFGISFLVLLLIDQKLRQNDLISLEYFRTRCLVVNRRAIRDLIRGVNRGHCVWCFAALWRVCLSYSERVLKRMLAVRPALF